MATGEMRGKAARTITQAIFSGPVSSWKIANWRGFPVFPEKSAVSLHFRLCGGGIEIRTLDTLVSR